MHVCIIYTPGCKLLVYNYILHANLACSYSTHTADGYQSSCGFVDGEYVCVASDVETLLIPCGRFTQQIGLAYTYYLLGSTRPLAEGTMDYLTMNVSRSDNGLHVCCKPNVSSNMSDYPCYRLNITCESLYYPPK